VPCSAWNQEGPLNKCCVIIVTSCGYDSGFIAKTSVVLVKRSNLSESCGEKLSGQKELLTYLEEDLKEATRGARLQLYPSL
jgi:hypothetical protein